MPKVTLSNLTVESSARDACKAVCSTTDQRLTWSNAGNGHGLLWTVKDGERTATGTIPVNAHGRENVRPALKELIKAIDEFKLEH